MRQKSGEVPVKIQKSRGHKPPLTSVTIFQSKGSSLVKMVPSGLRLWRIRDLSGAFLNSEKFPILNFMEPFSM